MDKKQFAILCAVTVIGAVVVAEPAFAQATGTAGDGSWADPIVTLFQSIQSGIGKLIIIVCGIGLMVWGGWGAITGRMEWAGALIRVVGGIIGVAAPSASAALLGSGGV